MKTSFSLTSKHAGNICFTKVSTSVCVQMQIFYEPTRELWLTRVNKTLTKTHSIFKSGPERTKFLLITAFFHRILQGHTLRHLICILFNTVTSQAFMHCIKKYWNPHLKNDMERLVEGMLWTMWIQNFLFSWKAFVTYLHLLSSWALFVSLLLCWCIEISFQAVSGLTARSKDSAGEVIFLSLDSVQCGERVLLPGSFVQGEFWKF